MMCAYYNNYSASFAYLKAQPTPGLEAVDRSDSSPAIADPAVATRLAEIELRLSRGEAFRIRCLDLLKRLNTGLQDLHLAHFKHYEEWKHTAEWDRDDLTGQIMRLEKEVSKIMDDLDAHGLRRTETSG